MPNPLVSVIMPVYNAGSFLADSVQSVLAQTLTDWELILVDDGSTDNSPSLCDAFAQKDSRIHVLHQSNSGALASRGAGYMASCGDYVLFADSDDLLAPFMLESLTGLCQRSKLPASCCGFICFDKEKPLAQKEKPALDYETFSAPSHLNALLHDSRINLGLWNKLYQRSLLEGLSFQLPVVINEDLMMNWKILSRAKGLAFSSYPGYLYRQHESSVSHRPLTESMVRDQLYVADQIIKSSCGTPMEDSAKAFRYEKLLYLDSMILRRQNATDYITLHRELQRQLRIGFWQHIRLRDLPLVMKLCAFPACWCSPLYGLICRLLLKDRR